MSKYLIEQENKTIRLVEERGVAAFPYRTAINEILNYCKKQCVGMKPGDTRKFSIPTFLTSKIDFVKYLDIDVTIEDGENKAYEHGGGVLHLRIDDKISDGKYESGRITIEGYSFYGILYERTILNSLYHELNHYYEAWKELNSTGSMSLYAKYSKKANVNTDWFQEQEINDVFRLILYRLYSETEMNALIASVYGDLEGMKSRRENFSEDIKNTQAYKVYKKIENVLPQIVEILKNNSHLVKPLMLQFKNNNFELNPYYKNENSYIKEFNRKTQYLLKCLIRGIGRTASLYYDSQEVPEDNVNITINNSN